MMSSGGGVVQRRQRHTAQTDDGATYRASPLESSTTISSGDSHDHNSSSHQHPRKFADEDNEDGNGGGGDGEKDDKMKRLTLMEEVLLLGIKDTQGHLSFWNDNISYVLRGCILIELSLRNRIIAAREQRKKPPIERTVEVVSEKGMGEVLLDEALKIIKLESQDIPTWIDFLSGETWNLLKANYQLRQVRERIAKGLVDKGVLRTEKMNFVLFDMPTHPLADYRVKEALIRRVTDALLDRGPPPSRKTVALIGAAYAANVLENALSGLSHAQRDIALQKADDMLLEHSNLTEKARAIGTTDIMAGVFSVYARMDSLV